jgi:hypothetical protein
MSLKPNKVSLYSYNVYFGDCFLLVFEYEDRNRSVLIDFGSTGKGKPHPDAVVDEDDETNKETTGHRLRRVAQHISLVCGEDGLDVVVATHRHKDHIYGFGLREAGRIIRDCKPKIVIQPWTEDPDDNRDLSNKTAAVDAEAFKNDPRKSFTSMLNDMHLVAESIETEALNLADSGVFKDTIATALKDKIVFAADDNKVKNRAAVDSLHAMGAAEGSASHYVHYGYDQIDWETILPGVNVHLLGPPRIEDSSEITSATSTSDEFWSLQAMNQYFWGLQAATNRTVSHQEGNKPLFPRGKTFTGKRPDNLTWIIRQLRNVRASQLLQIVRYVDSALNNTSVIMLFEVGDEKLLFPGDAQIENWRYVLNKAKTDNALRKLLRETTLYKVGHHGSRNATPKSLWDDFEKKIVPNRKSEKPLKTVVSTMVGKHGESPDTAVPLPLMVEIMKAESDFCSTEDLKGDEFFQLIEIPIG